MKTFNKIILTASALLGLAACNKGDDSFENKAYINASNLKSEVRVATDEGVSTLTRSLSVAVAQPIDKDINISLVKSADLLDTYREAYYDETAELLPDANCNLNGLSALIKAGDVTSSDVELTFTGLDKLDYSKKYVLPVTISAEGIGVLERAKTIYYVVMEGALVNTVADMYTNRAWPIWDNFEQVRNLETFTMEALINCHGFSSDRNINTIMGVEDHFLIRIGDTQIPQNQIQIATAVIDKEGGSTYRIGVTNSALQLRTDKWYHIAVTFDKGLIKVYLDGRLRAEQSVNPIANKPAPDGGNMEVPFTEVNLGAPHSDESDGKPRCFWIGYSYDDKRSFNGMIAEARVWNRVLSAEEINSPNHFYKLYADSIDESLLAYWKFDEGKGKIVIDHSVYGNNLEADRDFVWYSVALPEQE